jgi:hypothetical protein
MKENIFLFETILTTHTTDEFAVVNKYSILLFDSNHNKIFRHLHITWWETLSCLRVKG